VRVAHDARPGRRQRVHQGPALLFVRLEDGLSIGIDAELADEGHGAMAHRDFRQAREVEQAAERVALARRDYAVAQVRRHDVLVEMQQHHVEVARIDFAEGHQPRVGPQRPLIVGPHVGRGSAEPGD